MPEQRADDIAGVLLDFDGVISQHATRLLFWAVHDFVNARTPLPAESLLGVFKQITAFPMRESLTMLLSALDLADDYDLLAHELRDLLAVRGERFALADGFADFRVTCENQGIPVLVCSTMDRTTARRSLLESHFGDDDFVSLRSKAAPASYTSALRARDTEPSAWLLVDDSPLALRAAKLAGLRTAMMTNDIFTSEDALPLHDFIDTTVTSFDELTKHWEGGVRRTVTTPTASPRPPGPVAARTG